MSQESSLSPFRPWAIGVSLVVFLIAAYFFTFNGYKISGDEALLFDATESMARQGNFQLNYLFDAHPPTSLLNANPPSADTEPMQPVLAVPLFWIAQALPGIGMVHTVWLFDILVTALTAGTLYAYGLALGYSIRTAALTALIFGLATIAWPYSRTFFREPLFTWLALLSAVLMVRLRHQLSAHGRPVLTLAAFALAVTGLLFSKEAALLFLPVLVVEAFPVRLTRFRTTRQGVFALVGLALLAGLLAVIILNADKLFGIPNRYAFAQRLRAARENTSGMWVGIRGYMFSPARSLWVFSPVLLLGFWGWRRLIREHRWRQIAVPLVMLVVFIAGYAAVRGAEQWYGGTGWGARYLVPVTPFLALWLLPVMESLFEPGTAWWKRFTAGAVVLLSTGIQVLAAWVPVTAYYDTLGARGIVPWNEGAWSIRWSPFRVSLDLLGHHKSDLAWKYATSAAWVLPVLSVSLMIAALVAAAIWMRRIERSRLIFALTAGSLGVFTLVVLFGGLYAIRRDPRYYGDFRPARDLLSALEPQLESGDAIVLNDYTYAEFFMNYYKRAEPTVYTLPQSPGERFSPEQTPKIISANPDDLIHPSDTIILSNLRNHHQRVWLVLNSSSFIPWSVRPVEQYLARHYFPVREVKPSDLARAVLFDMTPAPPATAAAWPARPVNATLGTSLRLVGCDIPGGTTRKPGDMLPVSLLWETLAPVPQDYNVGVLLVQKDAPPVAQHDSFPVDGFEYTHTWPTGSLHRDNHGLALPAHLAPGEYELWVVVYWWQAPNDRLPVTDDQGKTLGDHVVLARIIVQP